MLSRVLRLRSCPLLSRTFSSQNYPPHEVLPMPALSPTMEIGGIARWSIQEGASFSAGDVMFECETDKATVDYEATDDGFLAKILLLDGSSDVAVGTPLAVTVEEAGDVAAFADYVTEPVATTNSQTPSSTQSSPPLTAPAQTGQSPLSHAGRTPSIQFRHGARDEINAALGRMAASAVGGNNNAAAAASLSTEDILKDPRGYQDVPLTAMRKIIAARLTESKATIPHYYSRMECNIDHMLSYRKTLKDVGVKVSVNDLVIVAAALALRDVPEANSFWNGASIEKNDTVDISVAVATEGGLITPIVKDADRIGLSVSCLLLFQLFLIFFLPFFSSLFLLSMTYD
jgi:pyruvate dehydrogenase E2 component (dihydrolipoamide acetyltransferase)